MIFKSIITSKKAEVLVLKVEWNLTKDDYLQPVVYFEPIEMNGVTGQRQESVNAPVSCQWILPFTLADQSQGAQTSTTFTTIDELTYCKPNQLLHGPEHIETGGEPLAAFRHTGPATLPIHYVFDSQRRPVFVTFTLLSWILSAIDLPKKP